MLTSNIMSQSSVLQRVSVRRLGMKHFLIVKEFGIWTGDVQNAVRVIVATTLLRYSTHFLFIKQ